MFIHFYLFSSIFMVISHHIHLDPQRDVANLESAAEMKWVKGKPSCHLVLIMGLTSSSKPGAKLSANIRYGTIPLLLKLLQPS